MNSELYHYGIKGMRWGVRRFQNADGSYTSAGKARYNTGKKLGAANSIANEGSNIVNRVRESNERISNRKSRPREMKPMDLSHMTDQQLRDKINRANLERQYTQLYGTPQVASGRERVMTVLEYAGTALVVGGSAIKIAQTIYDFKH